MSMPRTSLVYSHFRRSKCFQCERTNSRSGDLPPVLSFLDGFCLSPVFSSVKGPFLVHSIFSLSQCFECWYENVMPVLAVFQTVLSIGWSLIECQSSLAKRVEYWCYFVDGTALLCFTKKLNVILGVDFRTRIKKFSKVSHTFHRMFGCDVCFTEICWHWN